MKRLPQYDTTIKDGICVPVFTGYQEVSEQEFERAVNLVRSAAPEVADSVENYLRDEQWDDTKPRMTVFHAKEYQK